MVPQEASLLTLNNITKRFPGVLALDGLSIEFRKGEVHALLGENGAGKSTLIKILSGAYTPDEGYIQFGGSEYNQMNPRLAKELGIQVIYQEFNLVPTLSAAENIFLDELIGNGITVNKKAMYQKTEQLFQQMNVNLNPKTLVGDLSSAQQQIVEIAKSVSKKAKVLIMDEPSAPLSISEVKSMFDIVRKLKDDGVTIIYISHRMDELFEISDRITIMRDGTYIATKDTKDTNRQELVNLMVGRALKESYPERNTAPKETILEVESLSGNGFQNISFSLQKGEILGFSGLVGAGRTELMRAIFGAERPESGKIKLEGREVKIRRPLDAINYGIGLIPEDRKRQGVILRSTVKDNIALPNLKGLSKWQLVDSKKEIQLAEDYKSSLLIKTPTISQLVNNLSGGNQQKIVLAKWLAKNCKILIFDEPTRGIDVGAKQEIYKLMSSLAEQGVAVIMISSDMEELLGMSDRVIVLCEGRKTGEVNRDNFSQQAIMELASAN